MKLLGLLLILQLTHASDDDQQQQQQQQKQQQQQQQQQQVSPQKTLVFGPGLRADIVLPVRYIIIQCVDAKGQNLTTSPPGGKEFFLSHWNKQLQSISISPIPSLFKQIIFLP